MATKDVPGSNPRNHDKLGVGCWAEHSDGSLILVEGLEDDRVIYSIFDLNKSPMLEYRDAMLIGDFEKAFTCNSADIGQPYKTKDKKTVTKQQWTWHDKSQFPWDRILGVAADGPKFVSAHSLMSAAARVADDLKLRGADVSIRGLATRGTASGIRGRIGRALKALVD